MDLGELFAAAIQLGLTADHTDILALCDFFQCVAQAEDLLVTGVQQLTVDTLHLVVGDALEVAAFGKADPAVSA